MNPIVRANNLSKSFGNTVAMDNLNFTIHKGSIVGLIGPNGAGKTTTLKAILGLTGYEGELEVMGMDPSQGRHHIMEKVCFIADVGILPRWLKVCQAIEYVAGVHPRFNKDKAEAILAETKIQKDKKVSELSKGMITQLHLALILAIEVELLVLDEPTLGLDILYQKEFFDRLLNDYFDLETSIIISTHQVEEVRPLLTHVMFINNGKLVLDSSMDEVLESFIEVTVHPEQQEAALALNPVYVQEALAGKSMLFENIGREQLQELGDIQIPGLSDLFIAKMGKTTLQKELAGE